MEFYKEGRVIGLTANTRLDLSGGSYNHKGAVISGDSIAQVKIEFYSKGAVSQGITMIAGTVSPTNFTNSLIPVRLAGVTPNAAGVVLTLFN
jgi:hypothetical protein